MRIENKAVKLLITLLLILIALVVVYSFYSALIDAGYGVAPETLAAARSLSASLALLIMLSIRFSTQLLVALSTAYVLLELTLIPTPSLTRMTAFTMSLYLLAKTREGLDVRGLIPLITSSTAYIIGILIGVSCLLVLGYLISLPLNFLRGDVALFYSYLSVTRALSFIAFISLLAIVSRTIVSLVELIAALKYQNSYSTMAIEGFIKDESSDLTRPLSRAESLGLWLASTMMSLLVVTLAYELLQGGRPPTLAGAILTGITLTLFIAIGRIILARLMAGNWAPITIASLAIGLAILSILGPMPLYEAIGIARNSYKDPLSPIAMKELGLNVEEALHNAEVLAKILIKLFWGG